MSTRAAEATERLGVLIDSRWRAGAGPLLESRNPTTGELLVACASATPAEVNEAVAAAREAAPAWASVSPLRRTTLLRDIAQRIEDDHEGLVGLVVDEVGKPLREAREEVQRAAALAHYFAASTLNAEGETIPSPGGESFVYTTREPLGPVGLITPWNFPVAIPLWKIVPALAAGNTLVLKPSPHALATALRLAELFAALPTGVFNLVAGGAETGSALARSPLAGLSFTGSTKTGAAVARDVLTSGARYQAELGGKNASIVLADADLEHAAETIAGAAMGFAGQKCTATSRVIVETAIADDFSRLLCDRIADLRVGLPHDEETDLGPLIENAAVPRVAGFVERAVAEGAKLVIGGEARPDLGAAFYAPTLLTRVGAETELACTEVFGPVLALQVANDPEHALRIANTSPYGLAAAVFTNRLDRALAFSRRLEAGLIRVNGPTPGVFFNAPFAPAKESGIGLPELGTAARDFFTRQRTVTVLAR
jgi:acyl-CoA reductase-like NAD-dependent aldehyde dehydrogenase